jgi:hypothetical protein
MFQNLKFQHFDVLMLNTTKAGAYRWLSLEILFFSSSVVGYISNK